MEISCELTPGQREPLFKLVRHQKGKEGGVSIFSVDHGTRDKWTLLIKNWEQRDEGSVIVEAPQEIIEQWEACGYIRNSERLVGSGRSERAVHTLILNQSAVDYEEWMSKSAVARKVISGWDNLKNDIPSFVWGLLGGTISGVLVALANYLLGLDGA